MTHVYVCHKPVALSVDMSSGPPPPTPQVVPVAYRPAVLQSMEDALLLVRVGRELAALGRACYVVEEWCDDLGPCPPVPAWMAWASPSHAKENSVHAAMCASLPNISGSTWRGP
eukprot:COSAG01_NODE_35604_length_529_cov_2.318605_1_plen_114_part_00